MRLAARLMVPVVVGSTVLAATAQSGAAQMGGEHIASTWDYPSPVVRNFDTQAVTGTVETVTVKDSTANPNCDLYQTTYTIRWQTSGGHVITALAYYDNSFGAAFLRPGPQPVTSWALTPQGPTAFEQSPVAQNWFVKGTKRTDPSICPRDTLTVNHFEVIVDGAPSDSAAVRTEQRSLVPPPSPPHLAAVWTGPDNNTIVAPARLTVDQNVFTEPFNETEDCVGIVRIAEMTWQTTGDARIIAFGQTDANGVIQYQRGDATSISRGTGFVEWFLRGTTEKSPLCPPDSPSWGRFEVYTDTI